jgi:hypothetical protein
MEYVIGALTAIVVVILGLFILSALAAATGQSATYGIIALLGIGWSCCNHWSDSHDCWEIIMKLSEVLKQSLISVGKYMVGFVVFLVAFLGALDYLGFKIPLATFYNNLDPNGKITLSIALTIFICSFFFLITIYIINQLVREIDDSKRPIIKEKP